MVILVGYAAVTVLDEKVDSITPVVAFAFDTYCPINSLSKLVALNEQLVIQGVPPLDFDY
jgi:hypothetical protein